MKKRLIIIIICLLFTIPTIFALSIFLLSVSDQSHIYEGNKLIEKIEAYKKKNHELPESFEDMGINNADDKGLYYRAENHNVYIVWFGTGVGRSKVYHSDRQQWQDEN